MEDNEILGTDASWPRKNCSIHGAGAQGNTGTVQLASVIIPVYGNGYYLQKCLESLRSSTQQGFDVLLVDDASPQPIEDHLSLPGVRCCRLARNQGPSHAINRGVEQTQSEWVVALNSDVECEQASLIRLIQALQQHPDFDFGVAKLIHPTHPATIDSVGDALLIGGGGYRVGRGELAPGNYDSPCPVLSAAGTASVYSRRLLEEVGGFDEDFFGFLEDLDLSLRAQLRGYRCLYIPAAIVYHHGGVSFGSRGDKEIYRLITRNQVWVVAKNYPARVLARAFPRIMVFQLLWCALMVQRGFVKAYLRGMWEAFRGLPRMLRKRAEIQRGKKITSTRFWQLLRESESSIASWQKRLKPAERSLLLRIYFGLFGWPTTQERP